MGMTMKILAVAISSLAVFAGVPARSGEFDRLEGDGLARATQREDARRHDSLSVSQLERMTPVLADSRAAFLVVKTGQGNYTRILATPALRKPPGGEAEPVPVIVLDRFDTFEPGKSGSRLARGAGLILFEGFHVDLDTGHVVPAGQGGDLELRKAESGLPALAAIGGATLFTLSKPLPAAPATASPSPGKAIVPGDFGGRYRLFADGRWTGLMELDVAPDRQISGRFRSEVNGTSYPVKGQVSADSSQKAQFVIKFPQTEQEYDGWLWTEGKNVLAGSFTMRERTYGFFAIREGARVVPQD